MCRHAAYVGPGIAVSELFEMPHGLEHQAYAPKELITGTVCADGYGAAWYDEDHIEAARYAFSGPVWSDRNRSTLLPHVRSPMVMAAVRTATVAAQNIESNCAPFTHGPLALSHNGFLDDFPAWLPALEERLDGTHRQAIRGTTDSEHLLQLLRGILADHDGPGALATATQELCRWVKQTSLDVAGAGARDAYLNLLVSDGERLVATRCGTSGRQNSLYHLHDGDDFPGAHVVASEPLYDDPAWTPVAEDTLLVLQEGAPPVRMAI